MSDLVNNDTGRRAPARQTLIRAVLRNPLGAAASFVILCVVLIAILAPLIAPQDPTAVQIFKVNAPWDAEFLLGGDGSGRDILSRLIFGARNTLLGALIVVGVSSTLGVAAGLIGGYYAGRADTVFSWVADGLMALPAIIVLLAFHQVLGSSIYYSMAVFGILLTPGFFRLTRNLVASVRNELYIDAARVSGLSDSRIIFRHVLKTVRPPLVIQVSIVAGIAIIIQAGLEFLGLGDSQVPTWGGMLQDGFANLYVAPEAVWWPGLAISLTVASFVLLANAVRDTLQQNQPTGRKLAVDPSPVSQDGDAADSADIILSVRDLAVGYPDGDRWREVVRDVSFNVRRGEILGIVGESGSGKSQTAFAILGLLASGGTVLRGSIRFEGRDVTKLDFAARHALRGSQIAYVPQEPMSNLDPSFKIGFQLMEPMRTVLGLSKAQARARALELLGHVGLPNPLRTFNAYPHQISGGMAQRVLIAGAISCNPKLLIADEPTTALDVTVQAEILKLLRNLQSELGMSVIMVTHNFGVVADLCDRVAVMQQGRIVEINAAGTLFATPEQDYTKMLLSCVLEDSPVRAYVAPTAGGGN
ncbi:dipeptide/oligopeptide/nickel ABC transporter permease/ATP-binding protein [Rhizobium oryzicola]|uniref:Dipeptide/oligopeptide/nickel ABC transporter permease/ATP-binding protein n=1 Tax=Rhizobium oryzicola TaxID=1232668 RepID=A0ABT8SW21_9HYPH|nr:dipeptide/oligopeptide/nickel ABC transporter permease/ATP-binding protein [Rhizobium oryzicola]MDO1582640.1 dipeptide/oligopeptide/nickel ABC transporter permease/ATP-binding protein [Rhizobium oryzicola]